MVSFKKSSNTSFIVFIVSVLLTIFFAGRSKAAILCFNVCAFYIYKFLGLIAILAAIISFICIICYESCSNSKITTDKEELNRTYNLGKTSFLRFFKSYIRLDLKKDSNPNYEKDFEYLKSQFIKAYEDYTMHVTNLSKSLGEEDYIVKKEVIIPDYIEKLYTSVINDTLPSEEFVSVIDSDNDYLYENDLRYVTSENGKIYMLKDLFMERMTDIDKAVKEVI